MTRPSAPVEEKAVRANTPGVYFCPVCGEQLSGPARFYTCPQMPVENQGRDE